MLALCLRRWLNINPKLTHGMSGVWWDVVGDVGHISNEILGQQTICIQCRVGVKCFLESPHPNR